MRCSSGLKAIRLAKKMGSRIDPYYVAVRQLAAHNRPLLWRRRTLLLLRDMLGVCRHLASYRVLTISSIDQDGGRVKVNDLALSERSSL